LYLIALCLLGRFLIVGFTQGLPHHWWYTWLDRVLPGNSLSTVFKKIVADQVIASPYFHSAFFIGVGTLEGRSLSQCWEEIKSKFLLVYMVRFSVKNPQKIFLQDFSKLLRAIKILSFDYQGFFFTIRCSFGIH